MVHRFEHSQQSEVRKKITHFEAATDVLGESTFAAVDDARAWLAGRSGAGTS